MKKHIYLLVLALTATSLSVFAQHNGPSQELHEAKLLKARGKSSNTTKPTQVSQNRAPGDILHSFTFDTGLPTGWTLQDNAGIGGWEFNDGDSARSAQHTNPQLAMINSNSGGGYMHMPIEHYNTVPGSWPPVDNTTLVNADATITTNWLDVSGSPQVLLTFTSWFRHYYGSFDISFAVDGDESNWYTIDANVINGTPVETNNFPGPASSSPATGDGNNAVFPFYNLTNTAGSTFNTVKISFRVHSAHHYFWSIDDIQLIEPNENDVALVEVYAGNFYIHTTSAAQLYQTRNMNYSEVPGNILNRLQLGGLIHQNGANGENTRIDFAIDRAGVTDVWTGTSTTTIPSFGAVSTSDSILYTDTTNNYASGPNFYNPEYDLAWFETNGFYDDGIPYIFKYTAVTDNADTDASNNSQIYEYAQTWGRYSYHWQPSLSENVNINNSISPFQFTIAKAQGDLFLNRFDCFQAVDVAPEDEFKIYGIRFFLPADNFTNFDASGNGVEIKPIIYFWDSALQDWDVLTDAFVNESTTLHESQLNKWVYLPFENSGGEIDAIDFRSISPIFRVGIYVEDYHNQQFSIGLDTKYRQGEDHTVGWLGNSWRSLPADGSVMIDMYTKPEHLEHDMHLEVKKVSDNSSLNNVKIYPNPSTGLIKVTNAENTTINIYSITGNLIKSAKSNAVNVCIDLTGFAKGTYLVKVIKEDEIITEKVNLLK